MVDKEIKISVVVPCFNEEKNISNLISSLNKNTFKNFEIIVIDDNSTDNTIEVAKKLGAITFKNLKPKMGAGYGRNKGAKNAKGKIIVFFDAETIIEDKQFLTKILNYFEKNKNVFCARIKYNTPACTLVEEAVCLKEGITFEPRIWRKKDYFNVGGYPSIGISEDRMLSINSENYSIKTNKEIGIITETFFVGHGIHTIKELYSQTKWYGKTGLLYINQFKGIKKIKAFFGVYKRMFFLFSILLFPLFILLSLFILFDSRRRISLNLLRIPLQLIAGFGLLVGLINFLMGNKSAGK